MTSWIWRERGSTPGIKLQINPTYLTHPTIIHVLQGLVLVDLATGSSSATGCIGVSGGAGGEQPAKRIRK